MLITRCLYFSGEYREPIRGNVTLSQGLQDLFMPVRGISQVKLSDSKEVTNYGLRGRGVQIMELDEFYPGGQWKKISHGLNMRCPNLMHEVTFWLIGEKEAVVA